MTTTAAKQIIRATARREDLFRGEQPSFWNFWDHGVTPSLLDVYETCKEQCRLTYIKGYSSRKTAMEVEYGLCVHYVLERAYSQRRLPSAAKVREWVNEYERKWAGEVIAPTSEQLEQQELIYGMAEAVLVPYFHRWDGDFLGKYTFSTGDVRPVEWLRLETNFDVPYVFPDGAQTHLRGRIDGLFKSSKGQICVFDTKARGTFNEELTAETLPFDFQFMFYAYAETVLARLEKRNTPKVVVLNVPRRPMLRQKKTESLPEFIQRIADDAADSDRWDFYYNRLILRLGENDVDEWKVKQLDPVMDEVRLWWEGKVPHRMRSKSLILYNRPCALYNVLTRGDYTSVYKRKHVFPELPEVV